MGEKSGNLKALPFDTSMGFTGMPMAVCLYYVRHPRFNPSAERLYRYLLMRHNAKEGYAWPSWNAMRRETGLSTGTIKTSLDSLEHLGLINRLDHANDSGWDNKMYTFNRPIENESEFNMRFSTEIEELKAKKRKKGGARNTNPRKINLQDNSIAEKPEIQEERDELTSWL